jgi:hypothetical protein
MLILVIDTTGFSVSLALVKGVYVKKIKNLGRYEQCPCCDEACFYPIFRWADYSTAQNKR